jgi:hypothetical protein
MRNALVLCFMLLAVNGCKSKSEGDKAKPTPTPTTTKTPTPTDPGKVEPKPTDAAPAKAAAKSAVADKVAFEMSIYFTPKARAEPDKVLATLVKKFPGLNLVAKVSKDMKLPAVTTKVPSIGKYAPPSPEALKRAGRGLDADKIKGVQKSKGAFIMRFFTEGKDAARLYTAALMLVTQVAQQTGGLLWDEETQELFAPDVWALRIRAAKQVPLNILPHIIVRETSAGGTTRLVTRGMAKLGLPDLVVDAVPTALVPQARAFAQLMAQTVAEGGMVDAQGALAIDASALKNQVAKAKLAIGADGTGKASVSIGPGKSQRGDPRNRLWQVRFEGTATPAENQAALFKQVLGTPAKAAPAKAAPAKAAPAKAAPAKP